VSVLDHGPSTYHRYEYNFMDENFLGSDDPGESFERPERYFSGKSIFCSLTFETTHESVSMSCESQSNSLLQRLITVEDLYPDIIKLLIVTFGVNPEFFESHLSNSGYNNGQYNDPSPLSWRTAGMKASYVSLKWYRLLGDCPLFHSQPKTWKTC